MKTTDGSDEPRVGVADPVPGARSGEDPGRDREHDECAENGDCEAGSAESPEDVRPDPAERLAEEARRLAEAVAAQLGGVREQLGGVREEVREKVVDPLIRRHPEAAAHLGAAGAELLAAYRAFVADKERRWASRAAPAERVDLDPDPDDDAGDDRPRD